VTDLLAKYGCKTLDEIVVKAGKLSDGDPENGVAQNFDGAMAIYSDVMLAAPDHPGCLYGVGIIMREAGRYPFAIQIAKRVCEVRPKDPRGWKLLATVYGELNQYEESIRYAEKALECARTDYTLADYAYAHCNAGNFEKALKACEEAAKLPASALHREAMTNVRVSKAYCDLALGHWQEGFQGYRHTLRTKWRKERVYDGAGGDTHEWFGEADASVIVTGEQGLGDEIMAAGVIPDAAKSCQRFILDCDHRLAALFARSFPSVYVVPGRRQEQLSLPKSVGLPTRHKTLFGLSEMFRQKDADFPRVPYLIPNQAYVEMFRELFGGQKVIGLAWSGGLPRTGQAHRLAGLNAFLPLVRRGGAEFVSLEYKDDAAEVARFEAQHGVKVRRLPWVTQGPDMDLLAGLLAACSEVVGVHTSALHLASAVGVPTTILTHRGSGWRYAPKELLWYPETTKMHRKKTGESWRDCVGRL
jgi:tetratricopeptide (TPR) repeat protein